MKRLALLVLLAAGGCQSIGSPEAIALYANLASTALRTELELGVSNLTPEEIEKRRKVMAAVVPVTENIHATAVAYKAALDAAAPMAAKRGTASLPKAVKG